jgi:hypothetical protein
MDLAFRAALATSILLFLWYGGTALFGDGMVADFERFGLAHFRRVTGGFELLGALGLLAGLAVPRLVVPAATGLALLMVGGIVTRLRVRDPLLELLPAVVLLAINLFIVARAASR